MRVMTALLIISLFFGLAMLDTSMAKTRPVKQVDNSALTALAGEFRTVFANLLWIKAEHYHHEFIIHEPDWTKNSDVLGLDRLITRLDPHFEEAYAAGSQMLVGMNRLKEARAFLEEGVTNNPNSMMLHDEFGTFLARHVHDYKDSLFHLKRAYCLAKDDWDRRRLKRLMKTVEEMAKPSPSANIRS